MNKTNATVEEFDSYLNLITRAIEQGELPVAEKHIQSLCILAPNEEAIIFSLADVRMAMGNFEGAIQALEAVPAQFNSRDSFTARRKEYQLKIAEDISKREAEAAKETQFPPFRAETIIYPGLKVVIVDSISQWMNYYGFKKPGQIVEEGIDIVRFEEDKFERARRDAEVITTAAANSKNSILELGTSFGNGTYKLVTNLRADKTVYTVNILPEQFTGDCSLVTHLPPKERIGEYYRPFNFKNIEQIYANTLTWKIPPEISQLSMVFIDAAHDTESVYKDSLLTWERLAPGGIMIWHDFSPLFRGKFDWINSVMFGVTKFLDHIKLDKEVLNLRNSWMGALRKP